MENLEELRIFLKELEQICFQIFQSGFASVHDTTLQELKTHSKEAEDYGLFFASKTMYELLEILEGSRHQFSTDYTKAVILFGHLEEYLFWCLKKLELMQVRASLELQTEPL